MELVGTGKGLSIHRTLGTLQIKQLLRVVHSTTACTKHGQVGFLFALDVLMPWTSISQLMKLDHS